MNCSMSERLFTSESVCAGHPDKLADQISDAVLDAVLSQDPHGRVACETFLPNNTDVYVGGEITFKGSIDIEKVAREAIKKVGYNSEEHGLNWQTVRIHNLVKQQSPDISQGVTEGQGLHKEQGAGDQGLMFGFAVNETPELMPLPLVLSHKLCEKLEEVRQKGVIKYLRPDGKAQVTVEYDNSGKPKNVSTVVVSAQHEENISHEQIVKDIKEHVINPVLGHLTNEKTVYHVNPTGKFAVGGPAGDAGLTGRKIIVDTYGGGSFLYRAAHGGGCFSGKDPSKVDRSAAYAARYIAKNIVASGLAHACEVQLAYAIGVAEPVSVLVNTFGTGKVSNEVLSEQVRKLFPLKPADIIKHFNLKTPIYHQTATYGHFGKNNLPWEKTDKAEELKNAVN